MDVNEYLFRLLLPVAVVCLCVWTLVQQHTDRTHFNEYRSAAQLLCETRNVQTAFNVTREQRLADLQRTSTVPVIRAEAALHEQSVNELKATVVDCDKLVKAVTSSK